MCLASHGRVERFEAPGRIEQQGRSVAAASSGERDLGAQALQPRALKLVEGRKLCGAEQLERRVRCRSIELRLRGRLPQTPSLAEPAALGVARVSWATLLFRDVMARFEEQLASLQE
jgi:hypothetical protein